MVGEILRKRGEIVPRGDFKILLEKEQAIAKVAELAKLHDLPRIGLELRDVYGIPSFKMAYGVKLSRVIRYAIPRDLGNLLEKWARTSQHLAVNSRDTHAKVRNKIRESRLKSLFAKYEKCGRIDAALSGQLRLHNPRGLSVDRAKKFISIYGRKHALNGRIMRG